MLNCYHHGITHIEAETCLQRVGKEGSYLIRDSESKPGLFTLCILLGQSVIQYRILKDEALNKFYIKNGKDVNPTYFADIDVLLEYFVGKGANNGLVCALRHAVEYHPSGPDSDEDEEECLLAIHNSTATAEDAHSVPDTDIGLMDISQYLMRRFHKLDLSSQDGQFINLLKCYTETGIKADMLAIAETPEDGLPHLREMLSTTAKDLERQLVIFLSKIDVCHALFGNGKPLSKNDSTAFQHSVSISELVEQLGSCREVVQNLEQATIRMTTELKGGVEQVKRKPAIGMKQRSRPPIIPPATYEARLLRLGKPAHRVQFTVDFKLGRLLIIRYNDIQIDHKNMIKHDRVLQVIKSSNQSCKLDLVIKDRKKESYSFDSAWHREEFSQSVWQMKMMHSSNQYQNHLSVFVGTWNMGGSGPADDLDAWLSCQGDGYNRGIVFESVPHDLYAIGTQESSMLERDWVRLIKSTLMEWTEEEYYLVASCNLWGMRLIILAKRSYQHRISHVREATVSTGIANALGNKGATAICFDFDSTSLCFINSHLTSGHERCSKRNRNYHDIVRGLSKSFHRADVTQHFHHLFWFGDLNYRLEGMHPEKVIELISKGQQGFTELFPLDQLKDVRARHEAFVEFNEEGITFAPTYRFVKDADERYVWQKVKTTSIRINCPSWCDRILSKTLPLLFFRTNAYGMVPFICSSDHKPVFSSFDIALVKTISETRVSKQFMNKDNSIVIIFQEIVAEVQTLCQDHFFIEFHSPCLTGSIVGPSNQGFSSIDTPGVRMAVWSELPSLEPLIQDTTLLEDQHLHIFIKSETSAELYGVGVVALKPHISTSPISFKSTLTVYGGHIGCLRGKFFVKFPNHLRRLRSRKSYEFISVEENSMSAAESSPSSVGTSKQCSTPQDELGRQSRSSASNLSSVPNNSSECHAIDPLNYGNEATVDSNNVYSIPSSNALVASDKTDQNYETLGIHYELKNGDSNVIGDKEADSAEVSISNLDSKKSNHLQASSIEDGLHNIENDESSVPAIKADHSTTKSSDHWPIAWDSTSMVPLSSTSSLLSSSRVVDNRLVECKVDHAKLSEDFEVLNSNSSVSRPVMQSIFSAPVDKGQAPPKPERLLGSKQSSNVLVSDKTPWAVFHALSPSSGPILPYQEITQSSDMADKKSSNLTSLSFKDHPDFNSQLKKSINEQLRVSPLLRTRSSSVTHESSSANLSSVESESIPMRSKSTTLKYNRDAVYFESLYE